MKRIYWFVISLVLLTASVAGGFLVFKNYFSKETQTSVANTKPVTLDPQKEATQRDFTEE